jgi:hypothetical protein
MAVWNIENDFYNLPLSGPDSQEMVPVTWSGGGLSITTDCMFTKQGNNVTVNIPLFLGTMTSNGLLTAAIPSKYCDGGTYVFQITTWVFVNNAAVDGRLQIDLGNKLFTLSDKSGNALTAFPNNGLGNAINIAYTII